MAQRGAEITDWSTTVAREMRVVKVLDTKRVAVRFAVACARRSLPRYEKDYPGDKRVRAAVEAAEAYLKDPSKANRSAASAAASAARSAVWSAASAAKSAAWSAVWSAAAAASAAKSVEAFAARSVESWSSTWFAAESAAWSAARSAAWSAAESAARSATWSAEKEWQNMALIDIIIEEEYS